jgi:peptidoglycan/LPS O-acetylase OafA/YrhL
VKYDNQKFSIKTNLQMLERPLPVVNKSLRISEIDLLRFLAAMAVVLFHYAFRGYAADDLSVMNYPLLAPLAKYGYLGVDLFFMISGFVILMTAENASLKHFLISRVVRLYPAFWACCTITFLTILAIGGDRFTASWHQYLVNMFMLGGRFDLDAIDGSYWSLGVEVRFYLLVVIMLLLGKIHRVQPMLFVWVIGTVLVDLFPSIRMHGFLVIDYSGFFVAGAAFFLIWLHGLSAWRVALVLASWGLSLYQVLSVLPEFEDHYGTSMSRVVVAGIVSAFFVILLLVALRRTGAWGRRKWLWFGALSYPLYLIHQGVGFMIFNIAYPTINRHVLFWGTILVCVGIAYAVHVGVERRLAPVLKRSLIRSADALGSVAIALKERVRLLK